MIFTLLQLFFFFFPAVLLVAGIRRKGLRALASAAVSFLLTAEAAAWYFSGRFIDYRFYYHLSLDGLTAYGSHFISGFIGAALFFLAATLLGYYLTPRIARYSWYRARYLLPLAGLCLAMLFLPHGIFNEAYRLFRNVSVKEKNFNQALRDLGIPPDKYITPDRLTARAGKNLIVISIESLEKAFIDGTFDNLAPHLEKLSREWTFFDHLTVIDPGGYWTAGSLYCHQTGFPALFKNRCNHNFRGVTRVKLTGLGQILQKAGYESRYLVGNPRFAGMENILKAHHIPTVSEKNCLGEYPKVPHGLNDLDLFNEAKLQVAELSRDRNRPFALFMSTINTHFPDGIYDQRMEKYVPANRNELLFSVSAVDYLVNDFIDFLKARGLLENTTVFIFPDHPLMGTSGPIHARLRNTDRGLYLITNCKAQDLPYPTSEHLCQLNLPRLIVAGTGIRSNARFLCDFIPAEKLPGFVVTHQRRLTALNAASLHREVCADGIDIRYGHRSLKIKTSWKKIKFRLNPDGRGVYEIIFDSEMVYIDLRRVKTPAEAFTIHTWNRNFNYLYLLVFTDHDRISNIYFGNKLNVGIWKERTGEKEARLRAEDIARVKNANQLWINSGLAGLKSRESPVPPAESDRKSSR